MHSKYLNLTKKYVCVDFTNELHCLDSILTYVVSCFNVSKITAKLG